MNACTINVGSAERFAGVEVITNTEQERQELAPLFEAIQGAPFRERTALRHFLVRRHGHIADALPLPRRVEHFETDAAYPGIDSGDMNVPVATNLNDNCTPPLAGRPRVPVLRCPRLSTIDQNIDGIALTSTQTYDAIGRIGGLDEQDFAGSD